MCDFTPCATRVTERQRGQGIRTVQTLLGHADVGTTMIYTHVLEVGGGAVPSPLDTLPPTAWPAARTRLSDP